MGGFFSRPKEIEIDNVYHLGKTKYYYSISSSHLYIQFTLSQNLNSLIFFLAIDKVV